MNTQFIKRYIPLVLAAAVVVIIIGSLQLIFGGILPPENPAPEGTSSPVVLTPKVPPSRPLEARISVGDKILVNEEISTKNPAFEAAKKRGVKALAATNPNYDQAVKNFEEAIKKYRNAPETRIYLNNARIGTKKSRTIVVVVPTISEPNTALESLRGVAQAQTEINQDGGINGVSLKVAIANDDDDPKIAEQIALALVKDPNILGVVGHYSSDVTLAAGKVYSSHKLAVISAASTSVTLSNFPDIFRTVPSDASAAKLLARYMRTDLKQQYAAVFYKPNNEYSNSLKSEFVKAVRLQGGDVVDEIDLSEPGFSAFNSVKQAIERKAGVLMLAPTPDLLDKALQVIHVNGERLSLLGGDVVYDPKTLEVGSKMAAGMILATPWDIESDPKSSFSRQSREFWGADVNWLTAMAYDATQALITALKDSDSTIRADVQQALKAPDFFAQGASGIVSFEPSTGERDETFQLQLLEIRQSPSKTGYDFVPVRLN